MSLFCVCGPEARESKISHWAARSIPESRERICAAALSVRSQKNSARITLIVCSGSGRQTERADDKSISGAAHLTLTRFAQDQDKTGANLEAITREREPL
jgi:hypothetical protein